MIRPGACTLWAAAGLIGRISPASGRIAPSYTESRRIAPLGAFSGSGGVFIFPGPKIAQRGLKMRFRGCARFWA